MKVLVLGGTRQARLLADELVAAGDQVVTSGGLIGKVTRVDDQKNEIEVEIAPNVRVRVVRSTVSQVVSKTEPAEA